MKKISLIAVLGISAAILSGATAFAAQPAIYNGGLGQVASNPTSFGVAVCNRGTKDLTTAVPVNITANGHSTEVSSASTIPTGGCVYNYVSYSTFGMQPSTSYSVSVTVDNADQISYDLTTPSGSLSRNNVVSATANVGEQVGNIFTRIFKWFIGLFVGR